MRRVAGLLVIAAACTVPDYTFDPTPGDGGPGDGTPDAGASGDDDVVAHPEAGADAFISSDAGPLTTTAMPNTGAFESDCAAYVVDQMNDAVVVDSDGTRHCVMFFHNAGWRRTWSEGRVMCESITRGDAHGHLAVFPLAQKAAVVADSGPFPPTLATWIGLELRGAVATDKASWSWITGQAVAFDAWTANHPLGPSTCGSWAGSGAKGAQWTDVDCATLKGVLCEMDE